MKSKKHDFSMFTTTELQETIAKHEGMLSDLAEVNVPLVLEWISQGKQELTMRLIAGDDYATHGPDEENSKC